MNINVKAVLGLLFLVGMVIAGGILTSTTVESTPLTQLPTKTIVRRVIGPVATVGEEETNLQFLARVDTGAKTTSLHTAAKQIIDGSQYMEENLGKTVRFRIENRRGHSKWIERTIAEVRKIRTSEGEEMRYLVPMTFTVDEIQREVLVSLNDRSRMTYAMLLGRNFLAGEFVVDVTSTGGPPELLAIRDSK